MRMSDDDPARGRSTDLVGVGCDWGAVEFTAVLCHSLQETRRGHAKGTAPPLLYIRTGERFHFAQLREPPCPYRGDQHCPIAPQRYRWDSAEQGRRGA